MHFSLRPFTINDLDSLVKYANNPNIANNLTDKFPYPYTKENGKMFIEFATKNTPTTIFAIDINGEICGGIGIHPQEDVHRKNAELGYWLAEPFWGNGIITKAIIQIVEYGFINFDITRIFASPYGTNVASQRVLEKAGFTFEGRFEKTLFKNGEFKDELIYAVRKK